MREPRLFILTGNYQEFRHYKRLCSDNFLCKYVDDEQSIRGYQAEKYICVGNWMNKNRIHYLLDLLRAKGFEEVFSSDISEAFAEDQAEDRRRRDEYEREYQGNWDVIRDVERNWNLKRPTRREREYDRSLVDHIELKRKRTYEYQANKKIIVKNDFEFLSIEEMNL